MKQTYLFFCVILFVFYEASADILYQNEQNPNILLIFSTNEEHKELNKKFEDMTRKIGFNTLWIWEVENGLQEMVHLSSYNHIVINLRTFVNCSSFELLKGTNLIRFSDITECPSDGTETIFTENVLNYKRLYNAIFNKDFQVQDKILVGLPNNLPNVDNVKAKLGRSFPNLPLIFQDNNKMRNFSIDSSILTVVTPSPSYLETNTPTIIYNTPHTHPEDKDNLPNSINLLTSMKPLKYAILHFMNAMHWYRVAILSDDHEDSAEFLDDITPFLYNNGITYTTQTCSKRNCDFMDAALTLKNADTMIVILNLHPKNVDKIMAFVNHPVVALIKWIVRDWPFDKDQKFQNNIDLFSFTLTPVYSDLTQSWTNDDSPYVSGIMKSLEIVNTIYWRAHGDKQLFAKYFTKRARPPYSTFVHIVHKHHNQKFRVVATMEIVNGSNVNVIKFNQVFNQLPPDLTTYCTFRSKNFFEPCNDILLPFFLGIVIIFILISLIIMVFFSRSRGNVYERLF